MSVRPVVVLIHGVRASSAVWTQQLRAVHAAGYEAVAVTLPGHGDRQDEDFTLDGAIETIDAAVAHLDPEAPLVVVGVSLGGYLSLAYAARRPHRLGGVVAAACTAEPFGKPVRLYRDVARAALAVNSSLVASFLSARRGARGLVGLQTAAAPVAVLAPGTHPRPTWHVVTQVLTALAGTSAIDNLRRIAAPVWLVNGQRDHMRVEERRYLNARPDARLVVVRGAGHDVNLDAPEAFDRTLLSVLKNVEARAARHATLVEA